MPPVVRALGLVYALVLTGLTGCSGEGERPLVWEDQFDGPAGSFPDRSSWTAHPFPCASPVPNRTQRKRPATVEIVQEA